MTTVTIRKLQINEFKDVYAEIEKDFAPGEYAPYEVLYRQIEQGVQDGLIMQMDGQNVGYSICADGHANGYVLVSLLAIHESFRGKGFGSLFLDEIKNVYSDQNGIIVEVEKPEYAETREEEAARKRRVEFYRKSEFVLVPGIAYSIWDIPMDLMVYPLQRPLKDICESIGEIMYEIYLQLMGHRYIHKMQFRSLQ